MFSNTEPWIGQSSATSPSTSTPSQVCLSLSCIQLLDSAEFPELTEQKAETSAAPLWILLLSLCRLVSSFTSTFPVRPSPPSRLRPLTMLCTSDNCVSDVKLLLTASSVKHCHDLNSTTQKLLFFYLNPSWGIVLECTASCYINLCIMCSCCCL